MFYGQNGTGKSTLLHIIANIVNCDFIRFAFIEFSRIYVEYSNGEHITLTQVEKEDEKLILIEANGKSNLEFHKREAVELIRRREDERFPKEYAPELARK
ncbi:MAG: AAA family ATPase [Thiolinea sp.]